LAESTFDIPEELGFIAQFAIRGLEQKTGGGPSAGIVSRRDDAQALADQIGGRESRRAGPLQCPNVFCVETDPSLK
jgi:hypothetical protein